MASEALARTKIPSRDDLIEAVIWAKEAAAAGGWKYDPAAIRQDMMRRGMIKTNLYRWMREIDAGKLTRASMAVKEQAQARRLRAVIDITGGEPPPAPGEVPGEARAGAAMALIKATAERPPRDPSRPVDVIERIYSIVDDMELLIAYAKTPEGGVRNAKLLLLANREMRGTMETLVKIRDVLRDENAMEEWMAMLMREVAKESPACAERIARRLQAAMEIR